jgi:pSer/pThr/pTyr-binding forkhead associated (FHA) protein
MKVVLELQDQPSNIKKVTVRHDIVIGRGAECNLRLSAPQVSRRHCFLRIGSRGAFVSDLDSSNGTTLNGKRLSSGKRYELIDGAVLAVGPVKFVARVEAEVAASEVLEVVAGRQVQAESDGPFDDSRADVNFDATVAGCASEDHDSSMDFAVEHGGPSAGDDEPTADCVVEPVYLGSVSDEELVIFAPDDSDEEDPILGDLPLFEEATVASAVPDALLDVVEEIIELDDEDLELVDVGDVVEIIETDEPIEDEFIEVVEIFDDAMIDVIEEVDEILEIVDDDEVQLIDEEEIIEVLDVDDVPDSSFANVGDSVEDELKNFLQGLD